MHFFKDIVVFATLFVACISSSRADTEVPYVRSYFYTGGSYVDDGAGGHIFRDQMYVERLAPANGVKQKTPIVFIHGQAQTGTVSPSQHFTHNDSF